MARVYSEVSIEVFQGLNGCFPASFESLRGGDTGAFLSRFPFSQPLMNEMSFDHQALAAAEIFPNWDSGFRNKPEIWLNIRTS